MSSLQRIFLTGGSGYVGRNLITSLVSQGHAVVALARSEAAARAVEQRGARAFRADLLSGDLATGMQGCHAVVHAAADTDHVAGGGRQHRVNVDGTRRVIDASGQAGVARVLLLSTESVLASGRALPGVDERTPLPRRSIGGYSRSKAEAERVALAANSEHLAVSVLRPRFVWGRDDTTALPQLCDAARSGQLAWISGGNYLTSTTHIATLCAAVSAALRHARPGEVYFIADEQPVQFRAFITALLETQGIAAPEKSVPRALLWALASLGDALAAVSGGRVRGPLTRQQFAASAVEVTLDTRKARRELHLRDAITREQGLDELRLVRSGVRV
jgi:nucleoside-diphosphate-sugar epimerase